jgi:hypothetical protein
MFRVGLASWSCAVLLMVSACMDEGVSERAERCEAICSKFVLCDNRNDAGRCQRSCEAEAYWSDAYWEQRQRCVESQSCNMLPSSFDQLVGHQGLDTCILTGLRQIELTRVQARVCTSMATKFERCDSSLDADVLESQCTRDTVRQLSASYLEDSEECIIRRCGQIQPCLDSLAEDYFEAKIRIYEGSLNVD